MDVSPIVLDLETAGLPNAQDYLEPVQAARNLKDPEKIAADIATRTAERDAKLALDWNVGRIAALGWWTQEGGVIAATCETEGVERAMIDAFWRCARHRTIVGFNIKGFDLRFLIQRSRYLELVYPQLDLGKYTKRGITDLYDELTFGDRQYDQGCMRRTLTAFCRRFGMVCNDALAGKGMPALVESGDWAAVEAHLRSDLALTVALARRLGVLPLVTARDIAQMEESL